jgi:hypothetical protein
LTNLFPFAAGYAMWAGSCQDSDPQGAGTAGAYYPGATRDTAQVAATSGAPSPTAVTMAQVRVAVILDATGLPVVGATPQVAHAGSAFCDLPESYTLGATDSGGEVKASLPWGSWDFTVPGRTVTAPVTPTFAPTTSEIYVEVRVS